MKKTISETKLNTKNKFDELKNRIFLNKKKQPEKFAKSSS